MGRNITYIRAFCFLQLLSLSCGTGHVNSAREVYIPCESPCNNGLCDYTFGRCVCHPFYTGEQCDRPLIVPCGDYYCFNEGTCEVDATGSEYCQCPQGIDEEYCLVNDSCSVNLNNSSSCVTDPNVTLNVMSLQPCGQHYCYYGGTCVSSSCKCPCHTFGVYCEYVSAPSGQLTVVVIGHVTNATLIWTVPVGYEAIARYGGVCYRVSIQNMATGREETLTSSDTTISHILVHSTEYCFRVRAEVSAGAGAYSEMQCYTTPAAESQGVPVVSIAAPSAGVLVLLLLVAVTVATVCYIWRVKCRRWKGRVDGVQLSSIEATDIDGRMSIDVGECGQVAPIENIYSDIPSTDGVYQDIDDAVAEMYEIMNGHVEAHSRIDADNDRGCREGCRIPSPTSDVDAILDMYEHGGANGGAAVILPKVVDSATYIGTYI